MAQIKESSGGGRGAVIMAKMFRSDTEWKDISVLHKINLHKEQEQPPPNSTGDDTLLSARHEGDE